MTYIILLGTCILCVIVLAIPCFICAVVANSLASSLMPLVNRKRVTFWSTALVPLLLIVLLMLGTSHALSPQFRGPEILGLSIVAAATFAAVFGAWPLSYFATLRLLGVR